MPTLDNLHTIKNQLLFNMLFRQQVYLEGWKTGLAQNYQLVLRRLYGEFAIYFNQTRYKTMDQFTKAQLMEFVRRFVIVQTKFYSSYTQELIDILRQFLDVDLTQDKAILLRATGQTIAQAQASHAYDPNADASGIYGLAALDNTDQLWANVVNSPMPANGQLFQQTFKDFGTSNNKRLTGLLLKGYANGWTITQTQRLLLGVGDTFDGGLFGTLLNQHTAALWTVVQHINAEVTSAVSSTYYTNYQWVSVMDIKTTPICIDRNGNVYVYGEGPLPPAHYGCRSKAIGMATPDAQHDIPTSYYDWLTTQPMSFLSDVMSKQRAQQLLAGQLSAKAFTQISTENPLTLAQLKGKLDSILGVADNA